MVTTAQPTSSAEASAFHIIHAVVVYQSSASPGPRSQDSAWFFRCSSRIPPWPCTIAFGLPVVPEENTTNSGWSNGTGTTSGRSAPTPSSSADQDEESGTLHSPYSM